MSKYLPFFIVFLLFGCSQIKENINLINQYNMYIKSVKESNIEIVPNMLSSNLRIKIKKKGKDQFPIITSFPNAIRNIISHHQLLEEDKSCLTVNGYDENKNPLSIYIEYVNEDNKWLLSFVEIYYLDSPSEFKSHGICPTKFE